MDTQSLELDFQSERRSTVLSPLLALGPLALSLYTQRVISRCDPIEAIGEKGGGSIRVLR